MLSAAIALFFRSINDRLISEIRYLGKAGAKLRHHLLVALLSGTGTVCFGGAGYETQWRVGANRANRAG